ncbi:hypothetical protein H9P43_004436 [Blastocladiella emersonii ATCC 22665]|nr:hypothetical protein H9P43_004436 [Blastocladiella emersonii ATCC 22665]
MSHHKAKAVIPTEQLGDENPALEIHAGDHVKYNQMEVEGAPVSYGVVEEILTHDKSLGGRSHGKVHASDEHPKVVIRDDHTHKRTAYNPQVILAKEGDAPEPHTKGPEHPIITADVEDR